MGSGFRLSRELAIYYDVVIVFPCSFKLKFKVCGLLGNILFSLSNWQKLPEPAAPQKGFTPYHIPSFLRTPKRNSSKD